MNNVLIRPLESDDAKISWSWRNDSEIWKYTGSKPDKFITCEIESNWIENVLNQHDSKRFAILADNTYVGNVQLTSITDVDAEYHIFIGDKNYWGKGIAGIATSQILRYAKNILNLQKVYLHVNSENKNAIRTYEKCNFIKVNESVRMEINLSENLTPTVSVFMMVYNHENYLHEALNGILMQKCNFDFEIVVGEDFSKDNSRKILLDYLAKFPGKFKLLLPDRNIGANENQRLVLQNCTGKYVAICEGDDYWVDPLKLHKQIDFLEKNPKFLFSMGRVDVLTQKTGEITKMSEYVDPNINENYTLKDYIKGPFSQSSSFVFRNLKEAYPDWFYNVHAGDQSLVIINTGVDGNIKYHKDLFSIYRVNESSVTFDLDFKRLKKRGVFFLNKVNEYTNFKYNYIIQIRILINKFYYHSRSSNLIIKYTSLLIYRLLFNLVQKI